MTLIVRKIVYVIITSLFGLISPVISNVLSVTLLYIVDSTPTLKK